MLTTENKITHKVFPSTYLRKVVFAVSFAGLSEECFPALADSLKETLHIDFTRERIAAIGDDRPLFFGTEDHTVEWLIRNDRIEISVNEIYRSFEETLRPLIGQLQSILDAVRREATSIILEKINLIPVTLATFDEMKAHASDVLSATALEHWDDEYFQKDNSTLLYLAKSNVDDNLEIESISGFIVKNTTDEGQPSRYILDITARYSPAGHESVSDRASLMNGRVFDVFIQSVTPGIIKSMEEA